MTTTELLAIVRSRGFKVRLDENGQPYLVGERTEATEELLAVLKLKRHREAIIEELRRKQEKQ